MEFKEMVGVFYVQLVSEPTKNPTSLTDVNQYHGSRLVASVKMKRELTDEGNEDIP